MSDPKISEAAKDLWETLKSFPNCREYDVLGKDERVSLILAALQAALDKAASDERERLMRVADESDDKTIRDWLGFQGASEAPNE